MSIESLHGPPAPAGGVGPATKRLLSTVMERWPAHGKFLQQSFADRAPGVLTVTEIVADLAERLAESDGGSVASFADDYRYLCEKIVMPEELFFRREGRYRLSTFEEADREVYSNAPLMRRYMNGLIISDALWLNHVSAMADFALKYLPGPGGEGSHLEIGPGHGLLLQLAARFGRHRQLTAWDVSPTSVAMTGKVLELMGKREAVELAVRNIYDGEALKPHAGQFDSIILSEVVEHLEDPGGALSAVHGLGAPGGRIWINAPANGPAPDHLYLFHTPDELVKLVEAAGFSVVRVDSYPVTGATLERAIRQQLPISVCVEAVRP